jgi:hypothetical protein
MTEALDPNHSGLVSLDHHPARRAAVAGISVVNHHATRDRTAANHDFT